jgi:hypothetical protein
MASIIEEGPDQDGENDEINSENSHKSIELVKTNHVKINSNITSESDTGP